MGGSNHGLLSKKALPAQAALALTISLMITLFAPAAAETPDLGFSGFDMAPGIIYIGDAHADEMNDIVMLKITVNTTYSEGVTLNSLIIHRTGNASDADAESLILYMDNNSNEELDINTDLLLSSGGFEQGQVNFSVGLNVTPTGPLMLFVVLNISGQTASGKTMGVSIPTNESIFTEESADIEFHHPCCSKSSTILLDTDGDLNPDGTDADDDNDGYLDDVETSCGTDTKDSSSVPKDTDLDHVPDSMDTDDDNDGVTDKYDDFPLDASRQRDYTIVLIYAAVAVFITIALILFKRRRPVGLARKGVSGEGSQEDEGDFDAELDKDLDEDLDKDLEGSSDEGLDEDLNEG